MNLSKVKKIHNKAKNEAEAAVKAIYAKYEQELIDAIAEQVPVGLQLGSANGSSQIMKDGEFTGKGASVINLTKWINGGFEKSYMYLAELQYSDEFQGAFYLPMFIDGKKVIK